MHRRRHADRGQPRAGRRRDRQLHHHQHRSSRRQPGPPDPDQDRQRRDAPRPTDWTLSASGPTPISGPPGEPGDHRRRGRRRAPTAWPRPGPTGYSAGAWSCTGGGTLTGASLRPGRRRDRHAARSPTPFSPFLERGAFVIGDDGADARRDRHVVEPAMGEEEHSWAAIRLPRASRDLPPTFDPSAPEGRRDVDDRSGCQFESTQAGCRRSWR